MKESSGRGIVAGLTEGGKRFVMEFFVSVINLPKDAGEPLWSVNMWPDEKVTTEVNLSEKA